MNQLEELYQKRKENFQTKVAELNQKLMWVTILRVLTFLLAFSSIYFFRNNGQLALVSFLVFIILFALAVKKNKVLSDLKVFYNNLIDIQLAELKAIQFDFKSNNTGIQHKVYGHAYADDMDLFGNGSIFQMLTRAVTFGGSSALANQLLHIDTDVNSINEKQKAIQEISEKLDWQHNFRASQQKLENDVELKLTKLVVFKNAVSKVLFYLLPFLVFAALGLYIIDLVKVSVFIAAFFAALLFSGSYLKKTLIIATEAENLLKRISSDLSYIKLIEKEDFKEKNNQELKNKLGGSVKASDALKQLEAILNSFDNRNNLIMGVVLNGFLLWDVRSLKRFSEWITNHGDSIQEWLDVVHEMDARISLANYVYNRQDATFPIPLQQEHFYVSAENFGHPLINPLERVNNSMEIDGWNQIQIITGANMAGKSTFLRTVGLNLVLASIGLPITAEKMEFTPVALFSSMKTEDSLDQKESYFFAELKRLKQLVNQLESGVPTFAILDEILKGTNSRDKALGSAEFLKKLLKYKMSAIIATHDLSLCELSETYPLNISNYSFEVEMQNNDLQFDYKLRKGVCQNMNATFLLKKMELID